MRPHRFSEEQEQEIVRQYESGLSIRDLGKIWPMTEPCLWVLLKRRGVTLRDRRASKLNKRASEVIADYQSGMSMNDMTGKYGKTDAGIRKMLRRNGIAVRDLVDRRPAEEIVKLDQALDAYNNGVTGVQASALAGITPPRLSRYLGKHGIEARKAPGAARRLQVDESFFDVIDSDAKAYHLGFIAADGYVNEQIDALVVTLNSRDTDYLEHLKTDLRSDSQIILCRQKYARLTVCCQRITRALVSHGVCQAKSLILKPWKGQEELLRDYYRGLIDGDGWWTIDPRGHFNVGLCGTLAVVKSFADFIQECLGIRSHAIRPQPGCYEVVFGGNESVQAIAHLLYDGATRWLKRKKETVDKMIAWRREKKPRMYARQQQESTAYSHLTREMLLQAFAEHGSWNMAAVALGIPRGSMRLVKREFDLIDPTLRGRAGRKPSAS